MKVRDSGMPEQDFWETLFDVPRILDELGIDQRVGSAVEVGCGYGTFTVPVAQRIAGALHAFDIDAQMVAVTRRRLAAAGVRNAVVQEKDVIADGFGPLPAAAAVLLFNILHGEDPVGLLRRCAELLALEGRILAIHWRSDIATPRGPPLAIRPSSRDIARWGAESGLRAEVECLLPPWHFGVALRR